MRSLLIVGVMAVMIACPPVSHGFGLLKYVFDGISNQLGLDRGPVPKVLPQPDPNDCKSDDTPPHKVRNPRVHIQAEGF